MKRFNFYWLVVLIGSVQLAYSAQAIDPNEYYPDENLTEAFDFNITEPNESNSSFVITYPEVNGTGVVFYSLPVSEGLDRNDTATGKIKFTRSYNMSNPSDLDKWLSESSKSFHKRASAIVEKVNKKTGFSDSADSQKGISALATDYIYEHSDQNSSRRKVIDSMDEIYKGLMAKISNRKHIKCYVSRQLKPGYMCPLPTLENSFILGYAQKDSKEVSIDECNARCRIDKSCTSREMPFSEYAEVPLSQNLFAKNEYTLETNSRQIINSVEFSVNISDLNDTFMEEGRYHMRYGVQYYFKDAWHTKFEYYKLTIKDANTSLKFYLNLSADRVKITLYVPYEKKPKSIDYELPLLESEHKYILNSVRAKYAGTKHWFCSNTQYVFPDEDPTVACKDGVIKDAPTGSAVNQVCVPNALPSYRDAEYGAYKSEYICNSECFVSEDCIATYRQPSQVDYNGYVPSNKYDIEIGCVDAADNEACTQEICQSFYIEDSKPVLERIWTNNDDILVTVQDGARVPRVQRPKVDIAGELSSNGAPKDSVFKQEMKDAAYVSMIKRGTYNVSSKLLSENYPRQIASEYRADKATQRSSLSWLIKGTSSDYDNGVDYHFYSVLAVDVIYHPIGGILVGQNYIYGDDDPKIRAMDRIYLVETSGGWNVFKRTEYLKMYMKNNAGIYEWFNTEASSVTKNITFKDNQFTLYASSETLSAKSIFKFNSDNPYEKINISLDMQYLISQLPGVLFAKQSNTAGNRVLKIYSADSADLDTSSSAYIYGYNAYGLYFDHEASYADILASFSSNQFFDSMSKKAFPSKIKSETLFSDAQVKMWMHGNSTNASVNADFQPSYDEEGKKAFFFIFLYDK